MNLTPDLTPHPTPHLTPDPTPHPTPDPTCGVAHTERRATRQLMDSAIVADSGTVRDLHLPTTAVTVRLRVVTNEVGGL
jgi:hypothetical protein